MKKLIAAAFAVSLLIPAGAFADIKVILPQGTSLDSINYNYTTIQNLSKSRDERGTVYTSVPVKNNEAVIPVATAEGGTQYSFSLGGKNRFSVYAAPGDEILSEVVALDPIKVKTSGTPLYAGINEINEVVDPIKEKYSLLRQQENPPREEMDALLDDYDQTMKDFILENPANPTSVYALLELQGEDFLEYFNKISEGAKTSLLYPIAELKKQSVEKRADMDRRQKEMAKGDKMAPDFTLLDLQGKEVSLSDFRGKWVILDFWGSWCIWCIKGFPELKEAYEKYKDKLEIVGVDCNETEEAWRAGVKKYELPWINVYNPASTTLLEEYGVQGFPTKAIIDPEGKIRNITTGHKPEFFTILSNLIGQ